MILFLQPNDTFFFRDGRPFTKGEQSEGYSIFPPLPSTVLGALRTTYIAEFGDLPLFYAGGMRDIVGTPESLCDAIRLRGIFLTDNQSEVFFPVPLDLVFEKREKKNTNTPIHLLTSKVEDFHSNAHLDNHLAWVTSEPIDSEADGMLRFAQMSRFLQGDDSHLLLTGRVELIETEPKIGIARSRSTLTSEEGMLYRINMSRLSTGLGFLVDYHCKESLPSQGLLKLGGEAKSFVFKQSSYDPNPLSSILVEKVKAAIQSTGKFKLYFAMPTIFEQGWLPGWIDADTLAGEYSTPNISPIPIKLITAAVGKPITVGGWNIKKGEAKPTHRAVPAGSTYYFELTDTSRVDDLMSAFHYQNVSDELTEEGFGLAFVGVTKGGTP